MSDSIHPGGDRAIGGDRADGTHQPFAIVGENVEVGNAV
jgi:hypothetical protein